jgi:hypothetical protein
MRPISFPEVLATDWIPPIAVGRMELVHELARRMFERVRSRASPVFAGICGDPGSGSSTVARLAARELVSRLRSEDPVSSLELIALRTRYFDAPRAIASALLRRLDEGFDGKGFPVAEILAGFLRRLLRLGRKAVILFDDVVRHGPDLTLVLHALANPERFLPEGASGSPVCALLVAATPEAARGLSPDTFGQWTRLPSYSPGEIEQIRDDRLARAWGRALPVGQPNAVPQTSLARNAVDLLRILRQQLLPADDGRPPSPRHPTVPAHSLTMEPRIVRAIARSLEGRIARVADVRYWEARFACLEGAGPLAATTFWRRMVRLETRGLLHRSVRPGGPGGTQSVLELLRPIGEWPEFTGAPGIRPIGAPGSVIPREGMPEPAEGRDQRWAPSPVALPGISPA